MTVLTETVHDGEYFVSEANGGRSRETIALAVDAAVYLSGTVLKLTGTEHERFDGTGTAVAILYSEVDAIAAITPGVAHVRDMEYKDGKLIFDTVVQGEIDAGIASLLTAGMVARVND